MQEKHDFFRFGNMCDRKGLEIKYFSKKPQEMLSSFESLRAISGATLGRGDKRKFHFVTM